jgi:hypothetical protein
MISLPRHVPALLTLWNFNALPFGRPYAKYFAGGDSMKFGRQLLLAVSIWHLSVHEGISKPNAVRQGSAIQCPQGTHKRISLRSTERLPGASGTVRVERMGGTTEIEAEIDSMKPASLFGGDYNTYVLWVVPPEGPAENLGEITIEGDQGKLRASTAAASFAVLVTAEPHYLVSAPSGFVVLENKPSGARPDVHYAVIQGEYNFERNTLEDVKQASGRVHTEVRQAFTAVRLAQRARAPELATPEFMKAERSLDWTLKLWHQNGDREEIAAQARETVRLAVAAQRLAGDRAFQGSRIGTEGLGGGNEEPGRRDQRGFK